MKLFTIVQAHQGLQKLLGQDLPLRQAYQVMQLVEKCNPNLMFYANELKKAGEDEEKIKALNEYSIEMDLEKIRIPLDTDIRLTASDVKFLSPFVEFYERGAAL